MKEKINKNLLPYNGQVILHKQVLNAAMAVHYFEWLMDSIQWRSDEVFMYGKKIITKRKMAWYSTGDLKYTYSGITRSPYFFTDELFELKTLVESFCKESFNSCLLNLYHNGNEGMGWHSDNENSIIKGSTIASVSLGAARAFLFRHKSTKEKVSVWLESGSLLLMQGSTQEYWQHALPKTAKDPGPRINLTFRNMVEAY